MDKETVIRAWEACIEGNCSKCPLENNSPDCLNLCEKTVKVLKANDEAPKANPTYHTAIIFTKQDNLLKYFWGKSNLYSQEHYAREREVQLILLVRHEKEKCICRIKCPINPLPLKGEFEPVNAAAVQRLLVTLGWTFKEKIDLRMFQ